MSKRKLLLSEDEIDQLVAEEAANDDAWEDPVHVSRNGATIEIPAELIQRAAFLARLHRKESTRDWIADIIRDRIELEEAAYSATKKELAQSVR